MFFFRCFYFLFLLVRLLQWKFTSSFCKFPRDLLMAVYQMISSGVYASAIWNHRQSSRLLSQQKGEEEKKNTTTSCATRKCTTLGLIVTRCWYNLLIYYQQNCLFFAWFCNNFTTVIWYLCMVFVACLLFLPCTKINCTNFQRSLTHWLVALSIFICYFYFTIVSIQSLARFYLHSTNSMGHMRLASEKLKQISLTSQ